MCAGFRLQFAFQAFRSDHGDTGVADRCAVYGAGGWRDAVAEAVWNKGPAIPDVGISFTCDDFAGYLDVSFLPYWLVCGMGIVAGGSGDCYIFFDEWEEVEERRLKYWGGESLLLGRSMGEEKVCCWGWWEVGLGRWDDWQ